MGDANFRDGTTLDSWMGYFVRVGHQLHIHSARYVGLPVICSPRNKYKAKEDVREDGGKGERADCAAIPASRRRRSASRRQRELQRILCRAGRDTGHARRTLDRPDVHEPIHSEAGRAGSGALAAIDARIPVAANLSRA